MVTNFRRKVHAGADVLEKKMMAASDAMEYEQAIEYRELLNSVKQIAQKQKITSHSMEDRDVIAMARGRRGCCGAGILCPGWKDDRPGTFPVSPRPRQTIITRSSEALIKQFYCGNSIYPERDMGAGKISGDGSNRRVAHETPRSGR